MVKNILNNTETSSLNIQVESYQTDEFEFDLRAPLKQFYGVRRDNLLFLDLEIGLSESSLAMTWIPATIEI